MKRSAPSLFLRLLTAISAVLLLGAGALAYAAYDYAHTAADEAYDRLLLGAASQIGETVRLTGGEVTTAIPVSAFEMLSASRQERVFYRVTGPDGSFLTGYDDLGLPPDRIVPGPEPQLWDGVYKGYPVRVAAHWQYVADPARPGWATVIVAQTRESRDSLARELTLRAMLLVGVMSVIALAGTVLAVRYALQPLHRIERALGSRDPNDLTPLEVDAPPEIGELVQSINRFMGRLSARMDVLQRMIADAAHQLRTPIAALSAQVDLLQHEPNDEKRRHHLDRVSARTAQIGRLVSQFLTQAMVSHRAESATPGLVDLREILNLAMADAVPAAMPRDIAVEIVNTGPPVLVEGDAVSLREAIRNIAENAVHHGAPTRLAASVAETAEARTVAISDDGPGIPEQLWPKATDRFFRAAPDGTGSGLGLAIAADVARAHSAALTFSFTEDGLFRVSLVFPKTGATQA